MSKIVLQGYIDIPQANLQSAKAELPTHIEQTRKEDGCLIFSVEQDPIIENRYLVYEEFVSQAAFDAHQERARGSRWGEITKNADRKYAIKCV